MTLNESSPIKYSNTEFYYRIEKDQIKYLNTPQFKKVIKEWLEFWKFPTLTKIFINLLDMPIESFPYDITIFLIPNGLPLNGISYADSGILNRPFISILQDEDEINTKIRGILILKWNKRETPLTRTEFISLFWLINPNYVSQELGKSLLYEDFYIYKIFMDYIESINAEKVVSFIAWEFPKIKQTYRLYRALRKLKAGKKDNSLLNDISRLNFKNRIIELLDIFYLKGDYIKIKDDDNSIKRGDSFQFYYYNPKFDERLIPSDLTMKFLKSLKIYNFYTKGINPYSQKGAPLRTQFEKILTTKKELENYGEKIKRQLERFKGDLIKIQKATLSFNKKNGIRDGDTEILTDIFADILPLETLRRIFKDLSPIQEFILYSLLLLKKYNVQIYLFQPQTKKGKEFLLKFRNYHYCNIIESIPTQGSFYGLLINDNLEIDESIFSDDMLVKMFRVNGVIFTITIDEREFFIGNFIGHYRKSIEIYSKQVNVSAMSLSLFRGYGITKLCAFLSIFPGMDVFDILFNESTVFNAPVHKISEVMGFKYYGTIKHAIYVPNPSITDNKNPMGFSEENDSSDLSLLKCASVQRVFLRKEDIIDFTPKVMELNGYLSVFKTIF